LDKIIKQHVKEKKIATVTAVRPPARFGTLSIRGSRVTKFNEKDPQETGWINGGFFCLNRKVCEYITDSTTSFESEPVNQLVSIRQLSAFKHDGWWHPMDTLRDKRVLEDLWSQGNAPWAH
jgi:glucose-1-phosphate cytidylyltransferase